jgi:hypothetical protein
MKQITNKSSDRRVAPEPHKGRLCLATLAKLWRTEPESSLHREDLIEIARAELGKYDLTPDELDEAAPMLAKSLHMRLEQNGGQPLDETLKFDIERQVLDWCGCMNDAQRAATHSHSE